MQTSTGIIVLAAGSSSRMGRSKQLLEIQGTTLLVNAVDAALRCCPKNTIVVLGANEEQHRKIIARLPARIVVNRNWQKGMGSSLKFGLAELLKVYPTLHQVIIMVCDQPFVNAEILKGLIRAQERSEKNIVACRYAGTLGVPVLYTKAFFPHLMKVEDKEGAKRIINQNLNDVDFIEFEHGQHDLDTPDDIVRMRNVRL